MSVKIINFFKKYKSKKTSTDSKDATCFGLRHLHYGYFYPATF